MSLSGPEKPLTTAQMIGKRAAAMDRRNLFVIEDKATAGKIVSWILLIVGLAGFVEAVLPAVTGREETGSHDKRTVRFLSTGEREVGFNRAKIAGCLVVLSLCGFALVPRPK